MIWYRYVNEWFYSSIRQWTLLQQVFKYYFDCLDCLKIEIFNMDSKQILQQFRSHFTTKLHILFQKYFRNWTYLSFTADLLEFLNKNTLHLHRKLSSIFHWKIILQLKAYYFLWYHLESSFLQKFRIQFYKESFLCNFFIVLC